MSQTGHQKKRVDIQPASQKVLHRHSTSLQTRCNLVNQKLLALYSQVCQPLNMQAFEFVCIRIFCLQVFDSNSRSLAYLPGHYQVRHGVVTLIPPFSKVLFQHAYTIQNQTA